ncbi:MAG: SGNH/GDSL hydrolase family protein [Candidatus Dormibacteraeota bacterium]|nr:SGNH/GDSL hydrolase family protein [Candidatus Dormibacteraeota bacterium]
MSYIIWILLVVLALGQPAVKTSASATSASEVLGTHAIPADQGYRGKSYVALGDSISVGRYATTVDKVFPSLVASQLGMTLDLRAKSGAKAAWALTQLAAIAQKHAALVTIELGTNDVGFYTPLPDFAAQYESIVAALAVPGTRVVCIGSWLPSNAYDDIIASICERHGGTFVSLAGFYGDNSLHAADGAAVYLGRADWFHPGDAGHAAIAQAVLASLGSEVAMPELQVQQPQPPAGSGGSDVIRITPR